ncbi:hypothetical protein GCM10010297_12050 [Streptomyces malachitofuscus]|nr:hypothetical protein GCM10010297_12050 [Streptomyces malachitofuscus]
MPGTSWLPRTAYALPHEIEDAVDATAPQMPAEPAAMQLVFDFDEDDGE